MTTQPDQHEHRDLAPEAEPLDSAGKSLTDALRSSFFVLKMIMAVLCVLYLASNVRSLDTHEGALVLRLGDLRRVVDRPGLIAAFPYPIDEIVPLPTRRSNNLLVSSHTFFRRPDEIGRPMSAISRGIGAGLHPTLDGALLTADSGLVHTQWKVTYKFDDVRAFVSRIAGDRISSAELLIQTFVETVGIEVASEFTSEELIRTRVDRVQSEMKRRVSERLAAINSGIHITSIEMHEPTPPIQIRATFDNTQSAENRKQRRIRRGEKERATILNKAAGASYKRLIQLLDEIDRPETDTARSATLRAEVDRLLLNDAEGDAGKAIKLAGAYHATLVSRMESDVNQYLTLLPEYKRNPMMLINRLWEETKQKIFASPGVTKIYRPSGLKEFRVIIPRDPEESRIEEERRLQSQTFDAKQLIPDRLRPVGPEAD